MDSRGSTREHRVWPGRRGRGIYTEGDTDRGDSNLLLGRFVRLRFGFRSEREREREGSPVVGTQNGEGDKVWSAELVEVTTSQARQPTLDHARAFVGQAVECTSTAEVVVVVSDTE